MSLLVVGLVGHSLSSGVETWSLIVWMTGVTCLGVWSLMAAGKHWECAEEEGLTRRLASLGIGLGVGVAASIAAAYLNVSMNNGLPPMNVSPFLNSSVWYTSSQAPLLPAFLAYFGGMYGVTRWWNQVDPLRPSRLSLVATGFSVLGAGIVHTIFYFPQPWGLAVAATISVAAQLSAPWLSAEDRVRLRQFTAESASAPRQTSREAGCRGGGDFTGDFVMTILAMLVCLLLVCAAALVLPVAAAGGASTTRVDRSGGDGAGVPGDLLGRFARLGRCRRSPTAPGDGCGRVG